MQVRGDNKNSKKCSDESIELMEEMQIWKEFDFDKEDYRKLLRI